MFAQNDGTFLRERSLCLNQNIHFACYDMERILSFIISPGRPLKGYDKIIPFRYTKLKIMEFVDNNSSEKTQFWEIPNTNNLWSISLVIGKDFQLAPQTLHGDGIHATVNIF